MMPSPYRSAGLESTSPGRPRAAARPARLLALAAAAALLPGCESEVGPGSGEAVVIGDSAGVEIVENRSPAWDEGEGWTVSPDPEVRIGAVTADDPALELSQVSAVLRLGDGRIVVAEGLTQEVRWFDAQGRHLATRGGRGEGPAEFNFAGSLARLPGDTVVVMDQPRIKHVFFGPDMEFVRTEVLDQARLAETGPRAECPLTLLPDRSLVLCRPEPGGRPSDTEPGHFRSFTRFVRLSWDLESEHRLGLYSGLEQWGIEGPEGRVVFEIHPFHARTVTAVGGDPVRLAVARNPDYSIELWTPDGRLERIVRRPGAERRPTDEDRAEALEQFRFRLERFYDDAMRNRFLSEVPVPETIPPIRGMAVGREGELWVLRDTWSSADGTALYDVFDPTGRFLGSLELPEGFGIRDAGPDWVLGVRLDAQGVPFVELYRLTRTS